MEIYARNSEFVNKFLSYYGGRLKVEIELAKEVDYNEISKFLSCGEGKEEYLKNSKDIETIALAELIIKRFLVAN